VAKKRVRLVFLFQLKQATGKWLKFFVLAAIIVNMLTRRIKYNFYN